MKNSQLTNISCLIANPKTENRTVSKKKTSAKLKYVGVEELAKNEAVQGNVAVATFGAQPIVANHLTNDYSKVRNVLDAEVSVNDVPLMARVIVLTDGKFSAQDAKDEHYRFYPQNDIMVPSAANLMKLKGIVCDCVQIGASSESILLQSLTKTTNGKVFPDDHVDELVNMPSYLFAATKLLRQFQDLVEGDKDARQNEEATLHALLDSESSSREAIEREFSESEKENIIAIAMNFLKLPVRKVAEQQEYLVKELELELPPVGTRVRRGPDWDPKDNIDSNGPGTVVCHNNNGTVSVLWDCGIGPLPYHCYDPCQVLSTDNDERAVRDDGWIQVGCKVVRGPDWTHGDDDGGQGSCGVVCLCTRKGTVTVRWPSRKIGEYRYGDEVVLLDTSEEHAQAAGYDRSISTREFEPGNKHNPKEYRKIRMPVSDNSNLKLLKQSIFGGLIKKDRAADVQLKPESDSSTPDVQAKPETESYIPFLWSYQQEGQVEWTSFDASNNGKLESDWSKQRKTTMVSANNKR
ncbi:hypothetical protein KP79_PYT01986 [Mizuhopecten yessoensis]|uniref:MIB/HERC2 domain-containing protein n=1 Tax=Mizuhopecten yessoensis TaxID=6573 RepID=A0A210Q2I4_MIZYE|nr:hypothetical protein KP79_PYT01986 [Mizuhopecten yessoensis]